MQNKAMNIEDYALLKGWEYTQSKIFLEIPCRETQIKIKYI
jgi:hypothetical protein